MKNDSWELQLILGVSDGAKKLIKAWLQAEARESRLLPAPIAIVPFITTGIAGAFFGMNGGNLVSLGFVVGVCFMAITIAVVSIMAGEAFQALEDKRAHFHYIATNLRSMKNLSAIGELKERLNARRTKVLLLLPILAWFFSMPWHSDSFWSGLVKVVVSRDISYYHFTGVFDLVSVLAHLTVGCGFVGVAIAHYWLKQLESEAREFEAVE